MFEVDDPSDFKAIELQTLDEHLRCPICKEFFDTAMILTTCSHSFCALCIRRSLSAEQKCPNCRKPAFAADLRNNNDLNNVVQTWKRARSYLTNLEEKSDKGKNKVQSSPSSSQPQLEQQLEKTTISCEYESRPSQTRSSSRKEEDEDFIDSQSSSTTSRSTRRSTRIGTIKSSAESEKRAQEEEQLKSTSIVTCPVCQQEMSFAVFNVHLDRCMKGDSSIPEDNFKIEKMRIPGILKSGGSRNGNVNKGKKPTKVLYALKNEKEMRIVLRELGLPDHGDKSLKIWRHKEYINIYDANEDSPNPVGAAVLRRRLEESEQLYLSSKQSQAKRKDMNIVDHDYNQKYSNEFSRLVDGIKRRKT